MMKILITNIYGRLPTATELKAQNMVADIACHKLGMHELGIYSYPMESDSPDALSARLDGIFSSVSYGDMVIFQYPSWNGVEFDEAIIRKLKGYNDLKLIMFVHDVVPLMFAGNRYLMPRVVQHLNQADALILPNENMGEKLRQHGLTVTKLVYQRVWDHVSSPDLSLVPPFQKSVTFIGKPSKFEFIARWKYSEVKCAVTADPSTWEGSGDVEPIGWFMDDVTLLNALRKRGGFGLVWDENPDWVSYMKLNANFKYGTYLAAGIPIVVSKDLPEAVHVERKKLGLVVSSLREAVERIGLLTQQEYAEMQTAVDRFAPLLRDGLGTEKVLTEAIWKTLYE